MTVESGAPNRLDTAFLYLASRSSLVRFAILAEKPDRKPKTVWPSSSNS
jgi:hypothetical protein